MHRLEFEAHAAEQSELREIIREARRLGDRVQEREWEADHDPGLSEGELGNSEEGDAAGGQRSGVKQEEGGDDAGDGDAKGALQPSRRPRAASLAARQKKRGREWKTARLLCRCEACLGKDGEGDKLVSETTWQAP